jgi:hypothetical protein
MLTSSVRIGIAFLLVAGVVMMAEASWLLVRGRKKLAIRRTLTISLALAVAGGGEIVYADHLIAHRTWFYVANSAGVLLVLAGATYAAAMCRSQSLTPR